MRTAQSILLAGQLAMAAWLVPARAEDAAKGRGGPPAASVSGIIMPLDDESMYVRGTLGRTVVRWNDDTRVALAVNYRNAGNVTDAIRYRIHSSREQVEFPLPKGPHYAIRRTRYRQRDLEEAEKEKWLSARCLEVHCGGKLEDHMPTKDAPYYSGSFAFARGRGKPAQLIVGDTAYEVSMKKGGQATILIFGALTTADCRPFVNKATATGRKIDGGAILAERIIIDPVGDQVRNDDPKLPRYLFIGDSISGNYGRGLREALEGKANLHHPPTNCGPTGKGAASIDNWLGAYDVKGRHWDVISFNFGHWNAGGTKKLYQEQLGYVISRMEKTGAELIWVTTCPVPDGYDPAGELSSAGRAPGRKAGVMKKHLNPWALEVVRRHPAIAVCDQWQFVERALRRRAGRGARQVPGSGGREGPGASPQVAAREPGPERARGDAAGGARAVAPRAITCLQEGGRA
ncbi:MAG: SGNH/GDSL hydrolase family protein [Planctomycetota bacterium]